MRSMVALCAVVLAASVPASAATIALGSFDMGPGFYRLPNVRFEATGDATKERIWRPGLSTPATFDRGAYDTEAREISGLALTPVSESTSVAVEWKNPLVIATPSGDSANLHVEAEATYRIEIRDSPLPVTLALDPVTLEASVKAAEWAHVITDITFRAFVDGQLAATVSSDPGASHWTNLRLDYSCDPGGCSTALRGTRDGPYGLSATAGLTYVDVFGTLPPTGIDYQLASATLFFTPEPSTGLLLALGLVAIRLRSRVLQSTTR